MKRRQFIALLATLPFIGKIFPKPRHLTMMITQGCGYYGSAIMTSTKSVREIIESLPPSFNPILHDDQRGYGYVPNEGDVIREKPEQVEISLSDGTTTTQWRGSEHWGSSVNFVSWDGEPQPEPKILYCSGNSPEDMRALEVLREIGC